ncbi:hypothetical protein MKS88_004083 [Plasmodium brasilianum]|nr:conserved Plasmodium protein, unknown function [Plasmodium malariae]KAI4836293.1 hypothetical protein MKS88_004083 [Plasmodium brasilianum]SCO93555.1 conserved Plasmodium protein, unknown function [Plasmodium malariae]
MKKLYIILCLCLFGYIRTSDATNAVNKVKGTIKTVKKKVNRYSKRYRRSFMLKEEDVLGDYQLKAYYFFDDKFEKVFKWNLLYNFCKSNTLNVCNYIKLRKKFQKMYEDESFSFKKYFSGINLIFEQFSHKYQINILSISLERDNMAYIENEPKITEVIMESLANIVSKKKLKYPVDAPTWKLSFNYITGMKKLIITVPSHVPGLNFSLYYVVVAYSHYYSNLFTSIGDIFLKFNGSLKKHNVGYFTIDKQ